MTTDKERAAHHAWVAEKMVAAEKATRLRTALYVEEAKKAIDRLVYYATHAEAEAWARVDALRTECATLRAERDAALAELAKLREPAP